MWVGAASAGATAMPDATAAIDGTAVADGADEAGERLARLVPPLRPSFHKIAPPKTRPQTVRTTTK